MRKKENLSVQMLSAAELATQSVVELPDRELLSALINISGLAIDVSILENLLNGSFNGWTISALNGNTVTVTVTDNVSRNDLDVFCNQVVAVLSAQCNATLVN
jgi:hypothetical protein